jgi:hypothetical protein
MPSSSQISVRGCFRRPPGARRCVRQAPHDGSRPPSIRLPIETQLKDATVAEFKNYADSE